MEERNDYPNAIEMEKKLLSALMLKDGEVVPKIVALLTADELYRPEHQMVYRAILRLYTKGLPIEFLAVEEELRKVGDWQKIDHWYLLSLIDQTFTTAHAEFHASVIKEKAALRRFISYCRIAIDEAQKDIRPTAELILDAKRAFDQISRLDLPSKKSSRSDFFANHLHDEIQTMKNYMNRRCGFDNLDKLQFF